MEKKILIVTPAYNEELNIQYVIQDVRKHCGNMDWLIVNDASTDNTLEIIKKEGVNFLDNEKNCGARISAQRGVKYAYDHGYEYVITMDADRQHKAQEIEKLITKMKSTNADVVIGSRYFSTEKEKSKFQYLGKTLSSYYIKKKFNKKITDTTSCFRCMNRKVMKEIIDEKELKTLELSFLVGLLIKNFKIEEVEVQMDERIYGTSMFHGLLKKLKYVKLVITETRKKLRE